MVIEPSRRQVHDAGQLRACLRHDFPLVEKLGLVVSARNLVFRCVR